MELLNDLFVTASLALVLSFLVAKLLSMATATGHSHRDSDELITVEEVRSGQLLRVQSTRSQRKAEFPIQAESNLEIGHDRRAIVADSDVLGKVDEFQVDRHSEIEHNREEITVDSDVIEKADEFQVERHSETEHSRGEITVDSDAVKLPVMSPEEKSSEETVSEGSKIVELMEESVQGKTAEVHVYGKTGEFVCSPNLGGPAEQSNKEHVEEISKEPTSEKEIPDQSEEIPIFKGDGKERDEERGVTVDIEDDWEGIERSELEKVFMAATEFAVGSDSVASIGSDVQMELYGLHKVATEGPCREPQPMPLKLSARAKWYQTFPLFLHLCR